MTKKTRRKIDVAPRSVAIASTISGSLYGTCSICLFRIVFDPTWLQDRPFFKLVCSAWSWSSSLRQSGSYNPNVLALLIRTDSELQL